MAHISEKWNSDCNNCNNETCNVRMQNKIPYRYIFSFDLLPSVARRFTLLHGLAQWTVPEMPINALG